MFQCRFYQVHAKRSNVLEFNFVAQVPSTVLEFNFVAQVPSTVLEFNFVAQVSSIVLENNFVAQVPSAVLEIHSMFLIVLETDFYFKIPQFFPYHACHCTLIKCINGMLFNLSASTLKKRSLC